MDSHQFLNEINKSVSLIDKHKIKIATKIFKNIKKKNSKVIIVGNGGNSSTANHASNDFTNYAKIESINFNDHNLITCFANDFGYENWVKKALNYYCKKNDIVILLSAGGNSKNIINAAKYCLKKNVNTYHWSSQDVHKCLFSTKKNVKTYHWSSQDVNKCRKKQRHVNTYHWSSPRKQKVPGPQKFTITPHYILKLQIYHPWRPIC